MRAVNPIRATGLQYYFKVMRLKLPPDLTVEEPAQSRESVAAVYGSVAAPNRLFPDSHYENHEDAA